MSGTTDLAVRDDYAAAEQQAGALAIHAEQAEWTPMQLAALGQLGLADAPDGDRMVFLHVAQRTGLDPFARQIYMIGRPEKKSEKRGNQWVDTWTTKWTIQTGIDGFRVNRARAERKAGVRGTLGQAIYIDGEGNEYTRWFKPGPPAGCEITYTVREITDAGIVDTPYTSYLRFTEYAQYKADGKLNAKWSQSPSHMLEKCTEADVYRKAFPQDFSGIHLDDAVPLPDGGSAPEQAPQVQRPRVTAEQVRARKTTAGTVVTETPSPAAADATPSSESPAVDPHAVEPAAGEGPITEDTWTAITERLAELGVGEQNHVRFASQIARKAMKDATEADGRKVLDTLGGIDEAGLDGLRADLMMETDPRGDGEPGGE